jgi:putative transposase
VRAECLDHLLIFSHGQLQHVLHTYVEHYNAARDATASGSGRRGIGLGTPRPIVPGNPVGHLIRRDLLGGLIHEYRRAA